MTDETPSDDGMADSPFEPTDAPDDDPTMQPGGGSGGPLSRLFDGNAPGPSVQELQADYGLPRSWSIALRGCVRVATGSGIPPAFEIGLGSALGLRSMQTSDGGGLLDRDDGDNGMADIDVDGNLGEQ